MAETITPIEFGERLDAGRLVLALVGMSNVGKTRRSKQLAKELGFNHLDCDAMIEANLKTTLSALGYDGGIEDVARWMGQPYEPQYPQNEQTYLDFEEATMRRVLDDLNMNYPSGNTVIDTTGSVVHLSPAIRKGLKAASVVVYLEATPAIQKELLARFIEKPKPLAWCGEYSPMVGEDLKAALIRCYPDLLARRGTLYADMPHVTIPYEVSADLTGVNDFLQHVGSLLPTTS
ncbi:MAG: hypothetical protein V4702_04700 [Patescibacteria group bacterium]